MGDQSGPFLQVHFCLCRTQTPPGQTGPAPI
jgi:hypothetical protein